MKKKKAKWGQWVVDLAGHRLAVMWLFIVSFTESIFQPIPPDLMLAPMSAAKPNRWFYYATWCTIASALGGVGGWLLGYFAFELMEPYISALPGWEAGYPQVVEWLQRWGAWFVFLSGFTPLPYKFFTISAGILAVNLPAFILASVVGRGMRFFLVAWMMRSTSVWVSKKGKILPTGDK